MQAIVSKTLLFSCVDGPGNRMVLFLQGCNFSCPTCHNPHTKRRCNDCGLCIPVCAPKALSLVEGKIAFDASLCTNCDDCLRICPISANPMVSLMDVGQVLALTRQNLPFLTGITLSGGEATAQLKFSVALFTAIKEARDLAHLTCFVDTNGHLGPVGWDKLLPVTDGVMLDIKAFDEGQHIYLTGRGNDKSLASAELLAASGKLYELRLLMIPGKTDTRRELEALVALVKRLGAHTRVKLNAFHNHGVRGPASAWETMTKDRLEQIATTLRAAGLSQVITPVVWL
ncbi:YjjW family glycine radical enzyme activase [Rhodobacter ferrooxidans]|uniref:Radical SAM domain protein n=1 Tax=Rhodobacter ferrooxidans TaxID=371731 RepID=C8RX40_9RHOB|nr:YjjW family glycine radical enzyme activase [Rhodobacter sp. SW2]EEW26565.1 Radical SAM domain protein [Rhodobacter sp. SW2]